MSDELLAHGLGTLRGACLGNGRGFFLVRWSEPGGRWLQRWLSVARAREYGFVGFLAARYQTELFVVPRCVHGDSYASESSVLWARVSNGRQWDRLMFFHPPPTLVLCEAGSRRATALWALDRPIGVAWAQRGSERLAHELGTLRRDADPDAAVLTPPGGAVGVHSVTDAVYTPRAVVGGLRDAPDKDAWRAGKAA